MTAMGQIEHRGGLSSKDSGRARPEPTHGCGDDLGIRYAYRHLVGLVHPVTACDLIQAIREAPSLGLKTGGEGQHHDQRGYPVLVRNRIRIDAVANRFFIAVRQARYPPDPLEPGRGVDEGLPYAAAIAESRELETIEHA
jgi:hypothetical protein